MENNIIRKFRFLLVALVILVGSGGLIVSPAIITSICRVQGERATSPREGEYVTVQGVVFADLDQTSHKGFFIQDENCDSKPSTSDGIFVYSGQTLDLVNSGDQVQVSGWVNEYYGMTEISVYPDNVLVLSQGNPSPSPHELVPPFDSGVAISYFESLEGMHVSLVEGTVVGPTDVYDRTWLVRSDLGIQRVFWEDALGTGVIICVDDEGLAEIKPEVKVGDRVMGLVGVLDYSFDSYCLEPLDAPQVIEVVQEPAAPGFSLSQNGFNRNFATFNLGNLFDMVNDSATEDEVLSAAEYNRKLSKLAQAIHDTLGEPAIIAVQEAENSAVLSELIERPELEESYSIVLEEGPDRRGLDAGLLYRTDMVKVESFRVYQGCTELIDGLGPDGNLDVAHPQNSITCDSDGDGILDGNRLFSRPPLKVDARLCLPDCSLREFPVSLVVNHWKSKSEDSLSIQYTLPRRLEQTEFVARLAGQLLTEFPTVPVILLGDLNDTPGSAPLNILTQAGFRDLVLSMPKSEQYGYIYQGLSQALDHVLIGGSASFIPTDLDFVHINSDYPYSLSYDTATYLRSSDHDAFIVKFTVFDYQVFLPYIVNQ